MCNTISTNNSHFFVYDKFIYFKQRGKKLLCNNKNELNEKILCGVTHSGLMLLRL